MNLGLIGETSPYSVGDLATGKPIAFKHLVTVLESHNGSPREVSVRIFGPASHLITFANEIENDERDRKWGCFLLPDEPIKVLPYPPLDPNHLPGKKYEEYLEITLKNPPRINPPKPKMPKMPKTLPKPDLILPEEPEEKEEVDDYDDGRWDQM